MIWQFIRKHYPVKGLGGRQLHFPKDLMKSRNYCLMNTTIYSCLSRPVGFLWLHKVGLDRRVSKQRTMDERALSVLVQPMLGDCGAGTGSQRWTAAWRWSAKGFVCYSFKVFFYVWTSFSGCTKITKTEITFGHCTLFQFKVSSNKLPFRIQQF